MSHCLKDINTLKCYSLRWCPSGSRLIGITVTMCLPSTVSMISALYHNIKGARP